MHIAETGLRLSWDALTFSVMHESFHAVRHLTPCCMKEKPASAKWAWFGFKMVR